eukprot:TRINITY_DN7159_c0_g1_i1.p1 TRINITY_DN7159_c0_g1~~TRINITY_DN7159_c0_g1_i1.p1  ORF type:complete len:536 (-),score=151.20 TRINITY_DN7159_c0_g1_i1:520-2127(-)
MGKNRKGFIDRKKSATFRLVYRDYDPSNASAGERVFTRIDGGDNYIPGFTDDDPFASAATSQYGEAEDLDGGQFPASENGLRHGPLPEHVRKEIVELGFPDDGYNYLFHLREIKSGGSSAFVPVENTSKNVLPPDIKAYDASKVQVKPCEEEAHNVKDLNAISSNTRFVCNCGKAIDPEVVAFLESSDDSDTDSDAEGLEEDFVIQANTTDDVSIPDTLQSKQECVDASEFVGDENESLKFKESLDKALDHAEGVQRTARLLDEQFELLTLRDYGEADTADEFPLYDEGAVGTKDFKAPEISSAMKEFLMNNMDFQSNYTAPSDAHFSKTSVDKACTPNDKPVNDSVAPELETVPPSSLISKCKDYAEIYVNESEEENETMLVEDSSDESDAWDCETIVSTYSNLDNYPAKIGAPMKSDKKAVPKISESSLQNPPAIALKGKQQLPMDYLPQRRSRRGEKEKGMKEEKPAKKADTLCQSRAAETPEQRRERKAAVKRERREARKSKKEFKELYRGVAQHAQHAVAVSGPAKIHLM